MKTKLYWWIAAVVLGLAFALLPSLSLSWYWIYPFPTIPSVFWMVVADAIRSQLLTGCIAFCLGPAMFLLASPSLFRGEARISRASLWALLAVTVLEIVVLIFTRQGGYKYVPGRTLTSLTIMGSVIWLSALWVLFGAARVRQSYPWALAYNFVLVLWLLVYAFPWFGEMP